MRRVLLLLTAITLCGSALPGKAKSPGQAKGVGNTAMAPTPSSGSQQTSATKNPSDKTSGLDKILASMDSAARDFQSAQADFVWDQYESVVKETTTQKGVMYIRRAGNDVEMFANITQPPDQQKAVLFRGGKVQLYQPRIDQVTTYEAGKNRDAFQSFLVLGFGGSGHDLFKQFDVRYDGTEKVEGIDAGKLELTPKSPRVRGMFERILLWIDPARGVSVQQQFFEAGTGNFRLAKYSNIIPNHKIADSVFKLKTTGKTKFVSP